MAEYILHDGIDDYNQQQQQQHRQQDLRYSSNNSSGGANHLSSLMLAASDDLEIPLINVRSTWTERNISYLVPRCRTTKPHFYFLLLDLLAERQQWNRKWGWRGHGGAEAASELHFRAEGIPSSVQWIFEQQEGEATVNCGYFDLHAVHGEFCYLKRIIDELMIDSLCLSPFR